MPLLASGLIDWYQAPTERIMRDPRLLHNYELLVITIEQRKLLLPDERCEHVFCEVTNTINYAATPKFFSNLEEDFRTAGFDKKEISGDAMDDQERREFREMILNGGTYSG